MAANDNESNYEEEEERSSAFVEVLVDVPSVLSGAEVETNENIVEVNADEADKYIEELEMLVEEEDGDDDDNEEVGIVL